MKGLNLPFEKQIRKMFKDDQKIVTPSSVAATSTNNKELDSLFLGLKVVWVPICLIGLFALAILLISII